MNLHPLELRALLHHARRHALAAFRLPQRLHCGFIEQPRPRALLRVRVALIQSAASLRRHSLDPDLRRDGAAAAELPAPVPVARLVDPPRAVIEAGVVNLRESLIIELVIADYGTLLPVERKPHVRVDHPAAGRHGVNNRLLIGADGQFQRFGGRCLPVHQIAAARVAEVVVRGAVARVAPHPRHVEPSVRALDRPGEVGVHQALAVGQRLIEQALPRAGLRVVDVVDLVAVAASAVAVGEHHLIVLTAQEAGIGAARFSCSHHRFDTLERAGVPGLRRAEVLQRMPVHVAAQVQMAVAVGRHGHIVVRIPAERLGQHVERPLARLQASLGDSHPALGVIERRKLPAASRQQAEAHRVRRPYRSDVERFDDGGGLCRPRREHEREGSGCQKGCKADVHITSEYSPRDHPLRKACVRTGGFRTVCSGIAETQK